MYHGVFVNNVKEEALLVAVKVVNDGNFSFKASLDSFFYKAFQKR